MFRNLRRAAAARGLAFGLKLSNTLEVENWRSVFDRDPTMYLSGRPLHAVTVEPGRHPRRGVPGRAAALVRRRRRLLQRRRPAGLRHAHRHRLLGPPQVGRLPADAPVHRERRRRLRCRRRARHRRLHPPDGAGGRVRGRRRLDVADCARFNLRALRRPGPPRLALPEARRSGRTGPRRPAGWATSTASRRPASTSARSTSRCPATWPRCAPGISRRPSASPAWTTRCRRSWAGSATTCARTPASAPTSTSRWRSGRSSGSSWSRSGVAAAADAPAARCRGGAAPGQCRDAPGWRSSGPDRPAWRPRSGWPGPASASRSSRSTRTPAAWSAGRSRPTACRRRRSTRTSPSSSASASRSATAACRRRLHARRAARATGSRRSSSPSAPSGRRRSACRARMPGA